ncbi:MAG TPA: hypothetical protein VGB78_05470 [Thermoplasmata archaeon]
MPTKVVTDGTGLVDVIERAEEPEKHIDTEGILLSLAGIGCLVTGCAFIFFTEFWYSGLALYFATSIIALELYLDSDSQNRAKCENNPGEKT